MLNYDFERVKFTKIACCEDADVAIDEFGEIWYLGGRVFKDKYI